jgi:hypothetical protein
MKRLHMILVLLLCINLGFFYTFAAEGDPFRGLPSNVTLHIANLDQTGSLIYVGIDFAVFQDEDKDGVFQVKEDKVKRFITDHVNISVDLGSPSEYKKGVVHKLAMRTLYVPTGPEGDGTGEIVIADYDNGKEGWVLIPNSEFIPTYFASQDDSPFVTHTTKWNTNRVQYNTSKIIAGEPTMIRSAGTFWSGEKFVLNVKTTEEIPAVRVSIKDTAYSKTLTATELTASGGAIYSGELWDEEMLNKWGNYIPEQLTFTIDAMDGTDVLETFDTTITVDNRDLYYRTKQEY